MTSEGKRACGMGKKRVFLPVKLSSCSKHSVGRGSGGGVRRGPLVRRTHSPKTVPSPLSSPRSPVTKIIVGAAIPVDVFVPEAKSTLKHNSLGNANLCPVNSKLFKVKSLPPTVRGIAEAARILRNEKHDSEPTSGIIAFPCETVYALGCDATDRNVISKLITLKRSQLDLKVVSSTDNQTEDKFTFADPPVVYIASTAQARKMIRFRPPRTYALVRPKPASSAAGKTDDYPNRDSDHRTGTTSTSACGNAKSIKRTGEPNIDCPKLDKKPTNSDESKKETYPTAVLSEGSAVFARLASAFWPGPLVIFAPARHESSSFKKDDGLPNSILIKINTSCNKGNSEKSSSDEHLYIGLRCPSHPLSQRLLTETGVPLVAFTAKIQCGDNENPDNGRGSSDTTSTDISSSSTATTDPFFPTKASHIKNSEPNGSSTTDNTIIFHCIDGEDKREMFAAPTCELSMPSTIVCIDESNRTINVVRNGAVINAQDIENSLKTRFHGGKKNHTKSQILMGLLSKWKVVVTKPNAMLNVNGTCEAQEINPSFISSKKLEKENEKRNFLEQEPSLSAATHKKRKPC